MYFAREPAAPPKLEVPAPKLKGLSGILKPSRSPQINDENTPPPPLTDVSMTETDEEEEILSENKRPVGAVLQLQESVWCLFRMVRTRFTCLTSH